MVVKQRKTLIIAASLMLLIGGAGTAGYLGWRQYTQSSAEDEREPVRYTRVCSEELIRRASEEVKQNQLEALQKTEDEIVKITDYEYDQNCLFILARHGLLRNDVTRTKKYLEQLEQAYIPGNYSKAFTIEPLTPKEIEGMVVFLEQREANLREQMEKQAEFRQRLDQAADEPERAQ